MTEMAGKQLKILSISDVELSLLYCSQTAERFSDVDLVISCGDLPASYLDYISSSINARCIMYSEITKTGMKYIRKEAKTHLYRLDMIYIDAVASIMDSF